MACSATDWLHEASQGLELRGQGCPDRLVQQPACNIDSEHVALLYNLHVAATALGLLNEVFVAIRRLRAETITGG